MARGEVHIGTSGWTYEHWLDRFYEREERRMSRLQQYARTFRSVEINASFYRLPTERAMRSWLEDTPDDFVFAAKVSRFITHMKRLRDPEVHIPIFYRRIETLAPKLGPLLIQLPPNFRCDLERLAAFVELLPRHRHTIEFRHDSWWTESVYDYLHGKGVALCQYHLAGRVSPDVVTADFVYIRLHGPGAAYQGSYDDEVLRDWAGRIDVWRRDGRDVYVYFDNDEKAYAAEDARRLQELVSA